MGSELGGAFLGKLSGFLNRQLTKMREILILERNVLVLGVTSALGTFGNSLWFFILPLYLRDLGVGTGGIGLLHTARYLLVFFTQPLGGYLADRLGRKRVILTGNLIGSCSVLLFALGGKSMVAMSAYLFFNLGSTLPTAALNSMLTESVPKERRGTAVGTFFTLASVLATLGPPLGGIVSETLGFKTLFFIGFSTLALMVLARLLYLKETMQPTPSLPSSTPLKEMITRSGEVFRNRDLSMLFLAFGVYTGALSLTDFLIPLYSQEQLRLGPKYIGLMYSVPSLANLVFSLPSGKVADRLGRRRCVLLSWAGRSLFTIAYVYSTSNFTAFLTFSGWTLFDILNRPARIVWISDMTQMENRGTVMGLFASFMNLFSLPGPALGGALYQISPAYPFYANIMLCMLAIVLLLKFSLETSYSKSSS